MFQLIYGLRCPASRVLASVALALSLTACATPAPEVSKTMSIDDMGREVVHYRICESTGIPLMREKACRFESVTHNYCYRSLGRVDCYEQPVAGRTAMRLAR